MIHGLEVAEAAAIINVALIIVQFTYPLLISLVAVGILKRTTNAATWSVFGQLIQRSKWPFLLQTDTSSGVKVDKRVRVLTILSTFAGVLFAVAAAITPLGLHSTLRSTEVDDTPFSYVKDNSAVGQATQAHDTYVANRICGANYAEDCPGNNDGYENWSNATAFGSRPKPGATNPFISTSIASNITDVFTSATSDSTVAGILDIQYRSFINYNNQTEPGEDENTLWIDQGRPRTQGQFRYFQQFLLENRTRPVEGLIVSTGDMPGVGFRNHTLPPSSTYGYSWEEDILWLEPETACTDLNITYDYTMPAPISYDGIPNARLTDRGGFTNLPHDYPYLDLNDTQNHPQLLARSWKAAVLTNNFIVKFMNESRKDFRMGKTYMLADYADYYNGSISPPSPNKVEFSSFGSSNLDQNVFTPNLPGDLSYMETDTSSVNYTNSSFSGSYFSLATVIVGYGGIDPLNISVAGAGGGLILGVGKMVDAEGNPLPEDQFRMDPGTNWSQPLYACTSAIKASVKRVSFQLNGTASVSNLVITNVESKKYDSDTMPVWGMENTGRDVKDLDPLWGLVSEESSKLPGLSVVRKPEFYLPASSASLFDVMTSQDAVAGAKAPLGAFGSIYTPSVLTDAPDYSGATNWLLHTKWQQLSVQATTAGKIPDLMWTDLMANALMSSKNILSGRPATNSSVPAVRRRDLSEKKTTSIPCRRYSASIAYDWKYAIPALVFLAMYAALFAGSLLMCCTRGLNLSILRFVLNQTSAGRAMTTERYQASSDVDFAKTSIWARARGDEIVRVGKHDVHRSEMGSSPQGYHAVETKSGAQESTTAYSH